MVKCPECGEEISSLIRTEALTYMYDISASGDLVYSVSDGGLGDFLCPQCEARLFDGEDEAEVKAFLKLK